METKYESVEETFARLEREGLLEKTGDRHRATHRALAIAGEDVNETIETLAELLEKLGMSR
jgi:Mn-dependent DtxR family transcriptional regulator